LRVPRFELVWQGEGRGLIGPAFEATFEDKAGLAFAPVHLRIGRSAIGGLQASWIRRGADIRDNWVGVAAENIGRFAVEFIRGGTVSSSENVAEALWNLPLESAAGDVLQVREIGPDGRHGWPAQLIL